MRARYLVVAALALGATRAAAQQPAGAAEPAGKAPYTELCKRCHGVRGTPPPSVLKKMKVPTIDASFVATRSADSIVTVLQKGKGEDMKSFTGKLTPAQMRDVAEYVRMLAAH
ncbi:MAG TPA: c-type cytochrome [Longimicrobiales bacterium]|nr:c-type cytochrome [Longimicrobiales bacterium]